MRWAKALVDNVSLPATRPQLAAQTPDHVRDQQGRSGGG